MVQLIDNGANAAEDSFRKWNALAHTAAQFAAGMQRKREHSDDQRARTRQFDRQDRLDVEAKNERSRQNTREDVQDVQNAERHEASMEAADWQRRRREIEDEQETAAQEVQSQLMTDAFGEVTSESTVPRVVQKRLAGLKEKIAKMNPDDARKLVAEEHAKAKEEIQERRRGMARELLQSLASPDPESGEPLLDEQRAQKYSKLIDGGMTPDGRKIAPADPDEVISGLMDFARAHADKLSHAEMRQASVARVDQAFTDAEGLGQQGAKYGVRGRDPGQLAKARAMRHMLNTLPFDAKRAADIEEKILGLLFDAPKGTEKEPRDQVLDEFQALAPEHRTPETLGRMRRSAAPGGMERARTAYDALGDSRPAPDGAGSPGDARPPLQATGAPGDEVPSTEHAVAVADATASLRMPQFRALQKEAEAAGVSRDEFPAWAKAKVERASRLSGAKAFVAKHPKATPQDFQAFVESGVEPESAKPEAKPLPLKWNEEKRRFESPDGGRIGGGRKTPPTSRQRFEETEDFVEFVAGSNDKRVSQWFKSNPPPARVKPKERAAWVERARKELGEWLGLE